MPIDVGSVAAVVGSLKTVQQMASGLFELRDKALIQSRVIELNQAIIDAQSSALLAQETEALLRQEIRSLKSQIADFEAWEATAQKYELKELMPGHFAYTLKSSMKGSEPAHQLCANCFQQRQNVIMDQAE